MRIGNCPATKGDPLSEIATFQRRVLLSRSMAIMELDVVVREVAARIMTGFESVPAMVITDKGTC